MNMTHDSPISTTGQFSGLAAGSPAAPAPLASVVIPTCNRPELLNDCLARVEQAIGAAGGSRIEVIVSDDSADTLTHDMLASNYPWARWIRGPRRGPAANRNTGVAAAAGEWIIFTDDDCLPEPLWLRAYLDALGANPACNVFEGKTVADRERRRLDEESPVNETGGYLWSCNMAIRRELFDGMSGFCESFPYAAMEDVDLRLRLLAQGERFPFVPEAVVCHPLRPSKGVRFAVKAGRSYLHLVQRHPTLLGERPWLGFVLNSARRCKQLMRDTVRCRGRGLIHATGTLAVGLYFEWLSRMHRDTRAAKRGLQPTG